MAKNKKSFVLYNDQRGIFNKLSDEQAGILIKHIFSYVCDEDPKADFITELAFEPIKSTFKRDLKKFEERAARSRENGAKGGRPPKKESKTQKTQQDKKEPVKPRKKAFDLELCISELTEKQKELIRKWVNFRKDLKKPVKTNQAVNSLINKIKEHGDTKSEAVINNSIANEWQGLFWDRYQTPKQNRNRGGGVTF
jgi:hypothetical protein